MSWCLYDRGFNLQRYLCKRMSYSIQIPCLVRSHTPLPILTSHLDSGPPSTQWCAMTSMSLFHITFIWWLFYSQGLLKECNSMCATYLFQQDKQYDLEYDTGDKTIQCGRRNDVFKLWITWRAKVTDLWHSTDLSIYIHKLSGFLFIYLPNYFILI